MSDTSRILFRGRRIAAFLALLLFMWLSATPSLVGAREDMSAGECGDPTDGELASGGGNSYEVLQAGLQVQDLGQPTATPWRTGFVLLIPVLGSAGALVFVVLVSSRPAGGAK